MKRQKSRAGCMTALVATLVIVALVGIGVLIRWTRPQPPETDSPASPPAESTEPAAQPESTTPSPPETSLPGTTPHPPAPPPPSSAPPAPAPDAPPPFTTAPAADPDDAFAQARQHLESGNYQGARERALAALAARPGDADIETFLNDLAMPLLASQRPMPEKIEYVVKSGDYLGKLAATYNTPVALIAKANNIQGAIIRIGETLRLLDGNQHIFAVRVSKSRNDVLLTLDGQYFKRYSAATGRNNKTPTGTYKITDKIVHPAWHKPGAPAIPYGHPDNLLGTHWLAIDLPGYGFHGTWEPASIGSQTSDGCIRLLNEHIEELYTILPRGTLVTITE
ncbi:MAG: L,D-transpeptidase family protein [Kiritimatiellae bacterium]|nr:L,D-transpeptidase family protein [Kiritimatiellia bacterium]